MPVGRFAPSPSGPLHLGNLRTALLAWLFARSAGSGFLVRIEDLDPARSRPEHEQGQLADLRALGLDWDGEPVRQSERTARYRAAVERLEAAGAVYPCWCTRAEIRAAAQAPHGPLPDGAYPGTCRGLTAKQRAARARAAGRPPSLRIDARAVAVGRPPSLRLDTGAVAAAAPVAVSGAATGAAGEPAGAKAPPTAGFDDRLHGRFASAVDDFVLWRWDDTPAYNLAVVVDDADQSVGEVVRGDDLLDTTPRQILLQRALGLPTPAYAHVPLARRRRRPARQTPRRRHARRPRRAGRDAGRRPRLDGHEPRAGRAGRAPHGRRAGVALRSHGAARRADRLRRLIDGPWGESTTRCVANSTVAQADPRKANQRRDASGDRPSRRLRGACGSAGRGPRAVGGRRP